MLLSVSFSVVFKEIDSLQITGLQGPLCGKTRWFPHRNWSNEFTEGPTYTHTHAHARTLKAAWCSMITFEETSLFNLQKVSEEDSKGPERVNKWPRSMIAA
jgi:hypothetical protein